jgi:hypothetical protein
MKTKILFCIALSVALVTTAAVRLPGKDFSKVTLAKAKPVEQVFNSIHGHRQGRGATVAWSTSATSSTVSSFTTIRTYEDPNDPYAEWTVVGNQSCGSQRNYKNTETPVAPGFASYRVVATMNDGGYVYSEVVTIHIVQH